MCAIIVRYTLIYMIRPRKHTDTIMPTFQYYMYLLFQ